MHDVITILHVMISNVGWSFAYYRYYLTFLWCPIIDIYEE